MSHLPIADYALLSDCHSAALVSRAGSVDWLCLPRFDSPAVFGRLLDDEAGHWSIRPVGISTCTRRYLDGTLVLETRFETPGGVAVLTDALLVGRNEDAMGHRLGADAPHAMLRRILVERGAVEMEMEYAPRPEYGVVSPLLVHTDDGVLAHGGAAVLFLSCGAVSPEIERSTARSRFTVHEGEPVTLALRYRSSDDDIPPSWSTTDLTAEMEDTIRSWRTWSVNHQNYQGPWKEHVHLSGRVLQGLTYFPTGAMVAAPTTSLPEVVGGGKNWDYRFCWVRDASFTLQALWVAACPDESEKFFDFLAHAALSQIRVGGDLQIMFGVGGEHDLNERELPHLTGWRDSRPVRIGNAAWSQRQLDVYGELLAAVDRLRDKLPQLKGVTGEFLISLADTAAERWRERDSGIWEIRGEPRDYLYSKLMCWVALDRAIGLAELLGAEARIPAWDEARDAIRRAILTRGWSDRAGAFTQSFGDDALDASNLVMPMVGFLPATDERVRSTIEATVRGLTDDRGLVYRYRTLDGLDGEEGTFLLCTFWLAEALAAIAETSRARTTFEAAVRHANDLGLLSEEVESGTGELIGNFPQAFSHIGLVNAAWAISRAEERTRPPGG